MNRTWFCRRPRKGVSQKGGFVSVARTSFHKPILDMYNQLNEEGKSPICLFLTRKACADVNIQLLSTLQWRRSRGAAQANGCIAVFYSLFYVCVYGIYFKVLSMFRKKVLTNISSFTDSQGKGSGR